MLRRKKKNKQKLGQRLVQAGKITSEQLVELLERQQKTGGYLGRLLVENGHVTRDELDRYLPKRIAENRLRSVCEHYALDAAEFYRLETALKFTLFSDEPIKTLLMTSAVPGEGKTTTAVNMAVTMADRGIRVLVVDTDLRRPNVHRVLKMERGPGLADILREGLDFRDVMRKTRVENLWTISSCPYVPESVCKSLIFAYSAI